MHTIQKKSLISPLRVISALICALLITASCVTTAPDDGGTLRYARWLTLTDSTATVLNPWREGEALHSYDLRSYHRAVSATSLHAFLAYRLGALDHLAGAMDTRYIIAPELRGRLSDMGNSIAPDLERIKAAGCDLIFASPFENAGYGALETLGIPIVECADYMETSPLGRAEWMRFYGRLLDRAAQADSIFNAEEAAYQALCTRQQEAASPTVLLGKREGQAWYVPGGLSYMGQLLSDADTHYAFASEATTGSLPLDFETVYSRAGQSDLWLLTYAAPEPLTYAALAAEDGRYEQFRAFREHRIWGCNTLSVPYYDVLPWSPAALLRDVILIAHPERFPGEKPKYFHPLE